MECYIIDRSELSRVLDAEIKINNCNQFYFVKIDVDTLYINSAFLNVYIDKLRADFYNLVECDVFRVGVSELVIFMQPLEYCNFSDAFEIVKRKKITLGGEWIMNSISAGVSLFPVDGVTSEELIHAADVAAKVSQCHGARMAVEYRKDLERKYMPGYSLAQTHKIISGCFAVYQPIVDCRDNNIYCYEALIRHDSVLTSDILRAVAYYKLWPEIFDVMIRYVTDVLKVTSKPISINVTPSQICDAKLLIEGVMHAKKKGVAPSRIILEITENEPIIDSDAFMCNLQMLSNMGIKISLDDFGAGFSFFNRLGCGGIDHVKIDKGIISGMLLREDKHALIKLMKLYCDEMNISLIAEGVELYEEVEFLASMGITLMQGYAFSKPLELSELKSLYIGEYKATLKLSYQ